MSVDGAEACRFGRLGEAGTKESVNNTVIQHKTQITVTRYSNVSGAMDRTS